jgi:glycosyltransferase involved in cell wall biosynthesis
MSGPLVSILINNYNYASYLGAAIDSALGQRYPSTEVVIVDDGSTDNSREVISSYGSRVAPVFKENGGQASSFNAGVAACRGDILCFLDSDDFFYPEKVTRVVDFFLEQGVNSRPMMVHHLLAVRNDSGDPVEGGSYGKTHPSPMNLYEFAKRYSFLWYEAGPTTSISINRVLAERLFPIPEDGVRISGDDFIVCGASLIADVYSMGENLGGYRIHQKNNWFHSNRRKSEAFLCVLQDYLNTKLVENGKSPVIRFNDSIYVWPGLVEDERWVRLGWYILKQCIKQHDRYTALWVYYTMGKIIEHFKAKVGQKTSDQQRY